MKMGSEIVPLVNDGFYINSRLMACIGALLPGIACYLCIAYTYVFQTGHTRNYTTADCPNVHSGMPPISYSIETEPQKFFWLFVMFIHLPPRLSFPILYTRLFVSIQPKKSKEQWFQRVHFLYICFMIAEGAGLLLVTVFEMQHKFLLHAVGFVVWVVSLNFNMLFSVVLHSASGLRQLHPQLNATYRIKQVLFVCGFLLSISVAFSYILYITYCLHRAFVCFATAEYVLVGINSVFHFLVFWDFTTATKTVSRNVNHIETKQTGESFVKIMISKNAFYAVK